MRSPLLVVLLGASLGGCRCGGERRVVADLLETRGEVDAWIAQEAPRWSPARAGQRFREGDALTTHAGAGARLRLEDATSLRVAEKTVIRFGQGDQAGRIDLESGAADLQAGANAAEVDLAIGVASLSGGAELHLERQGDAQAIQVLVGRATLLGRDGERTALDQGLRYVVEMGRARVLAGPDAAPDAAPPPDAAPAEATVLARVEGKGVRARLGLAAPWRPLDPGEQPLAPGTSVDVRGRSSLTVTREGARASVRGPARAVVGAPEGVLLALERGRSELFATASDLRLAIPGGTALVVHEEGDGSRATLEVGPGGTRLRVTRGTVELAGAGGARERLAIGAEATIAPTGRIEVHDRPPTRADVTIPAADAVVIHDPHPPSAVRIRFPSACPRGGIVEVARRLGGLARAPSVVSGVGSAIVALPSGRSFYRVRCIAGGVLAGAAAAQGSVRILRDAGKRRLPRKIPHNTVDADGRAYRLVYQNLLPHVTFRWRTELHAGAYRLVLAGEDGSRRAIATAGPVHTLSSGELAEGRYRFWFEDGTARSEVSTLAIEFSNASPRAYIEDLVPSGASLRLSGATLNGWRVFVGDAAVALDRQSRFSVEVPRPSDGEGVAVKLVSPGGEIHYYLRRPER